MAKLLKLRRGTTTQHASFTGAEGELTVDITKDTAVVHDGSQAGGRPLAREDMSNVSSASIAGRLGTDSIATTKIAGGALPTDVTVASANINADAVNGSKIADNSINSEHYVDGSIDRVHLAADIVDGSKIADDSINSEHYVNGSIDTAHLANDIVDATKLINFPTNTILGRLTAGTGNSTTLSAADVRTIINVENGATADQTAAEIRTLVESASDSNVFTDADHSKLNGIESGATADQTKADIDALNINADQVDGLHGSQFVRSDTSDTMSGNLTVSGSLTTTNFIRVMSGVASSDIYMADSNETERRIHCNSNRIGFLTSTNAWGCYADNSGNWVAEGNVTAYSDARLKTDIHTINDALSICGKLRGVSYKWIKDGKASIGVIAQEVETVLPEVVVTNSGVNPVTQEIEEIKSVDYGKIVGVLINAINELKAEVDELKGGK